MGGTGGNGIGPSRIHVRAARQLPAAHPPAAPPARLGGGHRVVLRQKQLQLKDPACGVGRGAGQGLGVGGGRGAGVRRRGGGTLGRGTRAVVSRPPTSRARPGEDGVRRPRAAAQHPNTPPPPPPPPIHSLPLSPSYADCSGPKMATEKWRKLSSHGWAEMPGAWGAGGRAGGLAWGGCGAGAAAPGEGVRVREGAFPSPPSSRPTTAHAPVRAHVDAWRAQAPTPHSPPSPIHAPGSLIRRCVSCGVQGGRARPSVARARRQMSGGPARAPPARPTPAAAP